MRERPSAPIASLASIKNDGSILQDQPGPGGSRDALDQLRFEFDELCVIGAVADDRLGGELSRVRQWRLAGNARHRFFEVR